MTSVTRATVLAAADGLRATEPGPDAQARLDGVLRDIIADVVPTAADDLVDYTAYPTAPGCPVTGVLIDVALTRTDSVQVRSVAAVALAPTPDDTRLDGSVTISGLPVDASGDARTLHRSALSGDVHVSTPVDVADCGVVRVEVTSVDTSEPAAPTSPPPTTRRRTAAELAAARRTYDSALRAARTKYAKARKKAGRSKRKRVAAQKAYVTRKARAETAYRAATADVPVSPTGAPAPAAASTGSATVVISTDVGWGALV
jgi:hypothetical protein